LRQNPIAELSDEAVEVADGFFEMYLFVVAIDVALQRRDVPGDLRLIDVLINDIDDVADHCLLGDLSPDYLCPGEVKIHPYLGNSPFVDTNEILLNCKEANVVC
jgi:hypothetical protein